jgi:microcystin degradation protein MlrC
MRANSLTMEHSMRVFTASLATETNTFSPLPTNRDAFLNAFYAPPGAHPATPTLCSAPIVVARRFAGAEGITLIEGTAAWAEPAGIVGRQTYEDLRDEILTQLQASMPVDVVLFGLHGAMVATGYDDCEGDFLAKARAIVGPGAVVGVELDPHCHLTDAMVAAADLMLTFLEVPHTDFLERAEMLVPLSFAAARQEICPELSVFDCRAIANFPTSHGPGRGFVDRIRTLQGRDGVLAVSIVHGFPAADVADVGTKVLVMTDRRKAEGDALAMRLGREILDFYPDIPRGLAPEAAIDAALAIDGGPVVLADRWDNPGGGVAGDSTFLIEALLARPQIAAAVGALWDPVAVSFCTAAEPGTVMPLRFGGKAAATSGRPVDAQITVTQTTPDLRVPFMQSMVSLGPAAAIRVGRLDIVLASGRAQTFHPQVFSRLGIDIATKKIVVVKSANHFRAGFEAVAREILYVDCDGPYPSDPRKIAYTKIRRPIFPLDPDPWPSAVENARNP